MSSEPDFDRIYRLLEVNPADGWDAVRRAYRRKAQAFHPDKAHGNPKIEKIAKLRFEEVRRAYEELKRYNEIFGFLPPSGMRRPASKKKDNSWPSQQPRRKSKEKKAGGWAARGVSVLVLLVVGAIWFIPESGTKKGLSSGPNSDASKPVAAKPEIVIGMPLGEVIETWGRPDAIAGDLWTYDQSTMTLSDGRVLDWKDEAGFFGAGVTPQQGAATTTPYSERIKLGFSVHDVRRIQGDPIKSTDTEWDYGVSKIYFVDGKVAGWFNSPLNPLKISERDSQNDADKKPDP